MRTLSARELRLAVATVVVVAAAITFFTVRGQLETWKELKRQRVSAELKLFRQAELLNRRPELLRNFQRIRAQLPRHVEGRDIKSELSRQVQTLAMKSGLQLTGLTPEPEEFLPELDLYEMSIRCTWQGAPENLVDFLHRLHQLGAVTDIQELRLRSRSRNATELSGTFTLDFAYTRTGAAEEETSATPPDEPADVGAAP